MFDKFVIDKFEHREIIKIIIDNKIYESHVMSETL